MAKLGSNPAGSGTRAPDENQNKKKDKKLETATGHELDRVRDENDIHDKRKKKSADISVDIQRDKTIEDPIKRIDGIDIQKDPEKDPDQKERMKTLEGVIFTVLVKLKRDGHDITNKMELAMMLKFHNFGDVTLNDTQEAAVSKCKEMVIDQSADGSKYFAEQLPGIIEYAAAGDEVARRVVEGPQVSTADSKDDKKTVEKKEPSAVGALYDKAAQQLNGLPPIAKFALATAGVLCVGKVISMLLNRKENDQPWKKTLTYAIAGGVALGIALGPDRIAGFFEKMGLNIKDSWGKIKGWFGSLFGDKPEEAMEKLGTNEKSMYKSIGTFLKVPEKHIVALKDADYDDYCDETDGWLNQGKSYVFDKMIGDDEKLAGISMADRKAQMDTEKKVTELLVTYRAELKHQKPKTVGAALALLYNKGVFSPERQKKLDEQQKEDPETVINPDDHFVVDWRAAAGLREYVGEGGTRIKKVLSEYSAGEMASNPTAFMSELSGAALKDGFAMGVSGAGVFLWNGYKAYVLASGEQMIEMGSKLIHIRKLEDVGGVLKDYVWGGKYIILGSAAVMAVGGGVASIAQKIGFHESFPGLADSKKGVIENVRGGAVRGLGYGFMYPLKMLQLHGAAVRYAKVQGQAILRYDLPQHFEGIRNMMGMSKDMLCEQEARFYGKQFLKYNEMLTEAERVGKLKTWREHPGMHVEKNLTFFSKEHLERAVKRYARLFKDSYDRSYGKKTGAYEFEFDEKNTAQTYDKIKTALKQSGITSLSEPAILAKLGDAKAERTRIITDPDKFLSEHGIDPADKSPGNEAKIKKFWDDFDREIAENQLKGSTTPVLDRPDFARELRADKHAVEIKTALEGTTKEYTSPKGVKITEATINDVLKAHGIVPGGSDPAAEAEFKKSWYREMGENLERGEPIPADGMPKFAEMNRVHTLVSKDPTVARYKFRNMEIDLPVADVHTLTPAELKAKCMEVWKIQALQQVSVDSVSLVKDKMAGTAEYEYTVNGKRIKGRVTSAPNQMTVAEIKDRFLEEFGTDPKAVNVANTKGFEKACAKIIPAMDTLGLGMTIMLIYQLSTADDQKEAFISTTSGLMAYFGASKATDVFIGNKLTPSARIVVDLVGGLAGAIWGTAMFENWITEYFRTKPGSYALAQEGNELLKAWSYKQGSHLLIKIATKAAEKKLFQKVGLGAIEKAFAKTVTRKATKKFGQIASRQGCRQLLRLLGWRGATTAALLADNATVIGIADDILAGVFTISMTKDVIDIVRIWRQSAKVTEELSKRENAAFTEFHIVNKAGREAVDTQSKALGYKDFEEAKEQLPADAIMDMCLNQDQLVFEVVREGFEGSREVYTVKHRSFAGITIRDDKTGEEIASVSSDDADKVQEALNNSDAEHPQEAQIEMSTEQKAA
ncbi:hypothetical protein KBD59_03415 [Candidatus Gracilibacteria bacterium]|nr:hypothetical protein [Candidatus Gracilibacteria bacterium]